MTPDLKCGICWNQKRYSELWMSSICQFYCLNCQNSWTHRDPHGMNGSIHWMLIQAFLMKSWRKSGRHGNCGRRRKSCTNLIAELVINKPWIDGTRRWGWRRQRLELASELWGMKMMIGHLIELEPKWHVSYYLHFYFLFYAYLGIFFILFYFKFWSKKLIHKENLLLRKSERLSEWDLKLSPKESIVCSYQAILYNWVP